MADAKIINYGQPIGAGSTAIPDNQDAVVVIESSDNEFIRVDSTEGNERVKLVHTEFFLKSDSMNDTARGEIIPAGSAMTIRAPASGCDIVLSPGNTENLRAIAEGGLASPLYTVGMFATTGGGTVGTGGSSDATLEQSGASTFQTALHVGAAIKIVDSGDGEVFLRTVASITDANTLEMDEAAVVENGSAWYHDSGELFAAKTGDRKTLFAVDATGAIQAGSAAEDSHLENNITIGDSDALDLITTGKRNYVIGHASDNYKFTSGYRNVAAGFAAGEDTATAWDSVYIGAYAGQEVNANYNTYAGANAGQYASGTLNVAVGREALKSCTGANNVAVGAGSLVASGSAASCVAVGVSALAASTGSYNVAGGAHSLSNVDSGSSNTALGYNSGSVLEGGQKCIYIGKGAQASGADVTDEIAIGCDLTGGGSNKARIGQSAVHMEIDITDAGTPSWAATSDARIKDNITDTDLGLDFINAIRAVKHTVKNTQEWPEELKPDIDKERQVTRNVTVIDEDGNESVVQQTETIPPRPRHADNPTVNDGVIAQEIKAVCDAQGVTFSGWGEDTKGMQHIQYERFVMPLIKAVQELTARVAELEAGD